MAAVNTDHFDQCIRTLESSLSRLQATEPNSIDYEVFRQSTKHGLVDAAAVQRWFSYRDNRNDTAHDYGLSFAETTLILLPAFLNDAKALQTMLENKSEEG